MAKVPTLWIQHKRTKKKLKINQSQWAANISRMQRDWKVLRELGGDATKEQIADVAREDKIDAAWKRDPEREKRFGDKKRQFEARKIEVETKQLEEAKADDLTARQQIDALKVLGFRALQAKCKEITGQSARSYTETVKLLEKFFGVSWDE